MPSIQEMFDYERGIREEDGLGMSWVSMPITVLRYERPLRQEWQSQASKGDGGAE